jgi:putative membrane protein
VSAPAGALAELDRLLATSRCSGSFPSLGWSLEPGFLIPLAGALLLWSAGVFRLWRRAGFGRGATGGQAAAFLFGWLALAAALVSPLHAASRTIFTAHMIEHEVLMAIAAPLLVAARPLVAMLFALPFGCRVAVAGLVRRPLPRAAWRLATRPLPATVLHGLAIWIWHTPALFAAASSDPPLHWLQHASFFGTGLLFWWAILEPRDREGGYGIALLCLFLTTVHTGLLGVLLFVSPRPWFWGQSTGGPTYGLTPLEDQQLAGLMMWMPGSLPYFGAALLIAAHWIAGAPASPRHVPCCGTCES